MSHLDDPYAPGSTDFRIKRSPVPPKKAADEKDKRQSSGSDGDGDSSASSAPEGPFMSAEITADAVGEIFSGLTKPSAKEDAGTSKAGGKRRPGGELLQKKTKAVHKPWALHPGSIRDS